MINVYELGIGLGYDYVTSYLVTAKTRSDRLSRTDRQQSAKSGRSARDKICGCTAKAGVHQNDTQQSSEARKMIELTFENTDTSGSGGQEVGYLMILLLLVGGVLLALTASSPVAVAGGTGLIVIALLIYVRLLRKTPKLRYFRYFWLDQEGVHHIEGNCPTDRTAHFTWDEIQTAEASA